MAKATSKKTVMTHPESRRETKIDSSIYEPFKAAILQSLKGSKGKIFSELTDDVVKNIKRNLLRSKDLSHGILFLSFVILKQEG